MQLSPVISNWIYRNSAYGSTFRKRRSKIAAVPTHVPLEALYFVVGGFIVPPKENAGCTAAILDFLSCHHHFKGVNHFRKVLRKETTLNSLEFFF